ncbi:hypothetical protein FQP90_00960 [Paenarthrobacter nitroguajacolicus]|uniref:Uncharacterized protein n=1 Tax=Paenarthrobacter nitroguajacolicus TaxID=211146 RepID=A0A558HCD2_PAENT|nr:hypothetical protein [Paenarthrobacter nitroguajacolicus]TVU66744.1 hypothetical protein FQP90_00960 [Paenarthrobacter nitroguajacolicus]
MTRIPVMPPSFASLTYGQAPAQPIDDERLRMDFWADLGELIGAVAACVTLIFVVRATRHSGQAVQDAQRMLQLEGDRDERAVALEERRQASQLAFWPVRGEVDGTFQWGIELLNSSDAPVFSVELRRPEGKSGNGTLIPEIRAAAKILPPGRYFFSERKHWPVHVEPQRVLEPIPGNTDYMPSVRFNDSDGREWSRGSSGRLEQLAG